MEFDSIPKQTGIPKQHPFGGFEKHLIDDEIVTLKSKGASKVVTYCPNEFLSNIILVTNKTGDMRPVINLKTCFCSENSFQNGKHQHGFAIPLCKGIF